MLMCRFRPFAEHHPRVSHVPCAALGVQTPPGMNTNRQLGETPGCQPKVGQADGRPCGK